MFCYFSLTLLLTLHLPIFVEYGIGTYGPLLPCLSSVVERRTVDLDDDLSTNVFKSRYSDSHYPTDVRSSGAGALVSDVLDSIGGAMEAITNTIFKPKSSSEECLRLDGDVEKLLSQSSPFFDRTSNGAGDDGDGGGGRDFPSQLSSIHRKSKSSPHATSFFSPSRDLREQQLMRRSKNWRKLLPTLHLQKSLLEARKMANKGTITFFLLLTNPWSCQHLHFV